MVNTKWKAAVAVLAEAGSVALGSAVAQADPQPGGSDPVTRTLEDSGNAAKEGQQHTTEQDTANADVFR